MNNHSLSSKNSNDTRKQLGNLLFTWPLHQIGEFCTSLGARQWERPQGNLDVLLLHQITEYFCVSCMLLIKWKCTEERSFFWSCNLIMAVDPFTFHHVFHLYFITSTILSKEARSSNMKVSSISWKISFRGIDIFSSQIGSTVLCLSKPRFL